MKTASEMRAGIKGTKEYVIQQIAKAIEESVGARSVNWVVEEKRAVQIGVEFQRLGYEVFYLNFSDEERNLVNLEIKW